jgi:hypothetical protein
MCTMSSRYVYHVITICVPCHHYSVFHVITICVPCHNFMCNISSILAGMCNCLRSVYHVITISSILAAGRCNCLRSVMWEFRQLDQDGDRRLNHSELSVVEENHAERCVRPFLDACDHNLDSALTKDEWCCCFSDVGMCTQLKYGGQIELSHLSNNKRPNKSNTIIIQTSLDLSHFGNLFVHKTVVLIIHTPPNLVIFFFYCMNYRNLLCMYMYMNL